MTTQIYHTRNATTLPQEESQNINDETIFDLEWVRGKKFSTNLKSIDALNAPFLLYEYCQTLSLGLEGFPKGRKSAQ